MKRKKTAKRVPAKKTKAAPAVTSAHLPLQALPAPASLAPVKPAPKPRDRTILPANSLIRQKVLAIISMRVAGQDTPDIAKALGISERSVNQYMWLAGKNGWLKKHAVDPADRMEFELQHKVVRNLDEMLDSDSEERRDHATLEVAKGTLFKKMTAEGNAVPPVTMIGVRVEIVPGSNMTIREGTTGGSGHYIEGEVENG